MFAGDQRPTGALHYSLLAAQGVLLLRVRVNFVVLVGVRVDLMVLLMLMGVHLWVLLKGLVGIHLVVLLVRPVRVHLVVLLVGLQLVASGVGEHRLEHVRRLSGLVGWGIHDGCGSCRLRLGVLLLLLHLGRLAGIRDLGALL